MLELTQIRRVGHRAAAIQSLLITAKINGLNPADWLTDILDKLPTWPSRRIDELLPLANHNLGVNPLARWLGWTLTLDAIALALF